MKILFNDLRAQNFPLKEPFYKRLNGILENSSYILDGNVSEFEEKFAQFSNRKHSVGVSNGTDAIKLCVRSFEPSERNINYNSSQYFCGHCHCHIGRLRKRNIKDGRCGR